MKIAYAMKNIFAVVSLAMAMSAFAQTPAAPSASGLAASTASGGRTLVLGQSAALSGPVKDLGVKMRAGAVAYFDYVNAQGGVNGSKIELRTLDDGYEPERAKQNTDKFIADNVFALFGYVGTPTSNAARPSFEAAKLPFLFPFTGAGALRAPLSPLIFNMRASYGQETERIVDHVYGFGIARIGIFYQNDAYGQAGLAGTKAALDKRKIVLSGEGTVERNSSDVAAAFKAISAANPQAVVMVSTYAAAAEFVKLYKRSGKAVPQFYNVSFVGTSGLQQALGADAEGVVVSEVVPPFTDESLATVREFRELMKASKQEAQIDYTSYEGFLAAKIVVEGLRKSGANPTREALIKGLEQVRNFDIGDAFISFDANRHSGGEFVDLIMLRSNGSIVY